MRIGDVDYSKEIIKPILSLCKPNKEIIDILGSAYDVSFDKLLGALNELSFKVPVQIERNHRIIRNQSADLLKGRYIIHLDLKNYSEYFLINQINKVGSNSDEYLEVSCFSLSYELNDKMIRNYNVVSYNCKEILSDLLKETIWGIGYISHEFDLMYRTFEVSTATVFESIVDLAKTYNALIFYDTNKRLVSFYNPSNIGENKGFTISYGKYLESVNQEDNSEEIITRLKMFGKEEISIREVVPSGQTYVENFDYFIYPYEEVFYTTNKSFLVDDILSDWSKVGYSSNFYKQSNGLKINNTSGISRIISTGFEVKDFSLKTTVRNDTNSFGSKYGIIFGYKDNLNYYYINHERASHELDESVKMFKVLNGVVSELYSSKKIKRWSANIEHNVELEVLNGIVQFKIDGVLAFDYTDENIPLGSVGFICDNNSVLFSRISVETFNLTVVNVSEFFSSELCHYIKRYEKLLENSVGEFNTLVGYRTNYNEQLSLLKSELSEINVEYKKLLDERDILNTRIARNNDSIDRADNVEDSTDFLEETLSSLTTQRDGKLLEINEKKMEINQKESEIAVVQVQFDGVLHKIDLYRVKISLENNFPLKFLNERNQFVIEKEWQDTNITDPKDLLTEGLKVFEEFRKQKITASVDIVNLLAMVEEQVNWDKLNLGDEFNVEHERLNIEYEAKVTGINYDFEGNSIKLTISNVKDLYANKDKFLEMLYKSNKASSSVSMKEWEWDLALENKGSINDIINNIWDANRQSIIGAKDQVVEISDRGLIIRDENDPMKYLVAINGMLALTNDGGATFKHAITTEGIVGERIYGKIIMGVNLAIEDESGILTIQGSRGKIFNREGILRMHFGLVEENGLCGESFGLISENEITRVKVTDCEGFVIERKSLDTVNHPNGWEKVFWTDLDGTIFSHELVVSNIKVVSNKEWDKLVMDSELGYFDLGSFSTIVKDGKLTTDEKLDLITELRKISSSYMKILVQADKYTYVKRDDQIDFSSAFNGFDFSRVNSNIALIDTTPLTNAYLDLVNFMSSYVKITSTHPHKPIIILTEDEMTETTSDLGSNREQLILKFKAYYDEYEKLSDVIEDIIVYQGISMGENYNNVYIGEHGLVVVRDDKKYRAYLNATNGLALQKWENGQWVSKLFATLGDPMWEDGTLYAEGLVTKNLRIVRANMSDAIVFDWDDGITIYGNNDEEIRLNANEGIAIDVDGDKRIWIGNDGLMYAKKLYIQGDDETMITDIDGSYISDLTVNSLKTLGRGNAQQDIIHIAENYMKFKTHNGSDEMTKLEFTYEGSGATSYPVMKLGSPENGMGEFGTGSEVAKIYKDSNRFAIEYDAPTNKMTRFYFNDTDTDDEGQAVYFDSQGGVRFHSDNKFVAKTALNQYIRIVKDEDVRMQYGDDRTIVMDNDKIRLQFDVDNFIEISSNGIRLVGSRIDFN